MFIIFDTETTGLPRNFNAPISDTDNWPRMVQLAWQVHNAQGELVEVHNYIVKPEGYTIPFNATQIHGISTERALKHGKPLAEVLQLFSQAVAQSGFGVGHNIEFDYNIIGAEYLRAGLNNDLAALPSIDTKTYGTDFCQIPGGKGGAYKWPKLEELYVKLFDEPFAEAHNAAADVEATTRAFLEMVRRGIIPATACGLSEEGLAAFHRAQPQTIALIGLNIQPYEEEEPVMVDTPAVAPSTPDPQADAHPTAFVHLHVHSQYSVLQSTMDVKSLVNRAKEWGMPALALTDLGNLYGAFQFVRECKTAGIKPIVGAELYVCDDHLDRTRKDNGFPTVFLARNETGYRNLAKLSSIGFTKGFYYVPRIDKKVLLDHAEGLLVLSGGTMGELAYLALNVGERQAEEALVWWKSHFPDSFFVELTQHLLDEDRAKNDILTQLAQQHQVPVVAANNVFYLDRKDANAHDILLCVKEGELQSTPIGRGRGFRFGFPNDEFYLKSPAEMAALFPQTEALQNTIRVADLVEEYPLERNVLLPKFDIPESFIDPMDAADGGKRGENAYLRHLTYVGAEKRYGQLTETIQERLDFELQTIENTGYPGYFLIVQDFTAKAREMGVSVGPGRGSAAGSAVAYCIGITNVDPIKYDLLFERFLNPERVSLPDIDIDFDDEGRGKVIQYVIDKYGSDKVAQIITYGTMAAKSAIRDTARVLNLPLQDADRLAKLMPDGISLVTLLGSTEAELGTKLNGEDVVNARQLREWAKDGQHPMGQTLQQAAVLEGSLRNTGVHACGVIITPEELTNLVPVANAKDSELRVTQFDNSVVESAGLLKMDFLGLKTLSVINSAIQLIHNRHGVTIVPDDIPLDDPKTFELYQAGNTNGTFQFESPGMQKHLKALKPDKFEDLIAMNALYRPGPLEYIPNFIARKHGHEPVVYDLPEMEEYLAETYGITVYQEQVMLLSQKLAGFTKGEADTLRKAMGKKQKAVLDKMKDKFIAGCTERGHRADVCEKVWRDWEAFAQYAFNKSHSTCYSVVAFHTAYLKANYPAEYMAAVLSNNMSDIKKVTFFMDECRSRGIPVLGPDINESELDFSVNAKGEIRFGLGGMKGVGESAVQGIIHERALNGPFAGLYDFLRRINTQQVNKKTLECLAQGGAFDGFAGLHRAVFFAEEEGKTFVERCVKYAQDYRNNKDSPQASLFGESTEADVAEPPIPQVDPWPRLYLLNQEKAITGVFVSSHPLADFRAEMKHFCNTGVSDLEDLDRLLGKTLSFAGLVTSAQEMMTKAGDPWGKMIIEDQTGSFEWAMFREDYLKWRQFFTKDLIVHVKATVDKRVFKNKEGAETVRLNLVASQIKLMTKVAEEMIDGLELKLNLDAVSMQRIEALKAFMAQHSGKKRVVVNLTDPTDQTQLRLIARSGGIQFNNESLRQLDQILAGIPHKLLIN